jgi:hypothetical protein
MERGMTGARYVPAAGPTEEPIRYSTLYAAVIACVAFIALVTVAMLWIGFGVLAARAAAEKPSIQTCDSIMPRVEAGR